jgi:outer membrane biosynthesis protein TonB
MIRKFQQAIDKAKLHLGMSLSVVLHLGLFVLLLVNFPQCQRKRPPEIIVSLDLLPIAKVSNVENKQSIKPKKEEKPVEKPKPVEDKKPEPKTEPVEEKKEEKKPEPKPEPEKKPDLKPVEEKKLEPKVDKKKEEKKPEPKEKPVVKPKPKKPAKPKTNEYDSILKDLLKEEQTQDDTTEVAEKRSKGEYDPSLPLSLSVKDSIRKQIEQCWNPPAGNKDAGSLQVLLNISFKRDGTVANVEIVDNTRYGGNELYRVAADAAVRAVYKCSPLQNLPVEQYSIWQNLEFNFDPSDILQ